MVVRQDSQSGLTSSKGSCTNYHVQHCCASSWCSSWSLFDVLANNNNVRLCVLQGHPYNNPPRCLHFTGSAARICVAHNPIGTYLVSNDTQVRCREAALR
jgi:hypothetical protein